MLSDEQTKELVKLKPLSIYGAISLPTAPLGNAPRKENMRNYTHVRMPTKAELESLISYIAIERAFDPLDPTNEDGEYAEMKVSQACIAVFDDYKLEPGWFNAANKLMVVAWDDNLQHVQTYVFDVLGQLNPAGFDAEYTPLH
jgi:hypothetical protein